MSYRSEMPITLVWRDRVHSVVDLLTLVGVHFGEDRPVPARHPLVLGTPWQDADLFSTADDVGRRSVAVFSVACPAALGKPRGRFVRRRLKTMRLGLYRQAGATRRAGQDQEVVVETAPCRVPQSALIRCGALLR